MPPRRIDGLCLGGSKHSVIPTAMENLCECKSHGEGFYLEKDWLRFTPKDNVENIFSQTDEERDRLVERA